MRAAFFGIDAVLSAMRGAFFGIDAALSVMRGAFFGIDGALSVIAAAFFAIDATFFAARAAFFATRLTKCDAVEFDRVRWGERPFWNGQVFEAARRGGVRIATFQSRG